MVPKSLVCITILLSLYACRQDNRYADELEGLSEKLIASDPASALELADSALQIRNSDRSPVSTQIRLQLIRQQAFAGLRQMDSVIATGMRIRRLAEQVGDSLAMARSLLPVKGEVSMADQRELQPYLPGAARTFAARGMRYEEAVIDGLMGAIATREGNFSASMEQLYKTRNILERLDSIKPLYSVYMNIGNNLSAMGDLRASIGFYEKAGQVARRLKDSVRIASSLMNEGIARSDMKGYDSSRISFNEGLAFLPARGGEFLRLQLRFNLATLAEREGDLSLAEADYRQVLDEAMALGDPVAISMANSGMAGVMEKKGRVGVAIAMMENTVRQLDSIGLGHYAIDHTKKLISLYRSAGRYEEAFQASEKLHLLRDSLLSADKQKSVTELEVKYNYKKQEVEKKNLEQKLRTRNVITAALFIAVMGLLAIGGVLRQRNRYQRQLMASYQRLFENYRLKRDAPDTLMPSPAVGMPDDGMDEENPDPAENSAESPNGDSSQPSEEDKWVYERIRRYFMEDKVYLNPNLKVDDVASHLQIPTRRVTQVLRSVKGQGFSDFINRYRIDEATRIMDDNGADLHKIDVLAGRCGFNSRQNFRRVFEQVTGVNPSFYREKSKER
jgi:AraC-like DNA-binding protein